MIARSSVQGAPGLALPATARSAPPIEYEPFILDGGLPVSVVPESL